MHLLSEISKRTHVRWGNPCLTACDASVCVLFPVSDSSLLTSASETLPSNSIQSSESTRPSSVRAPSTSPLAPCSFISSMSFLITCTSWSEYRKSPPRGRIITYTGILTYCFTTCSRPVETQQRWHVWLLITCSSFYSFLLSTNPPRLGVRPPSVRLEHSSSLPAPVRADKRSNVTYLYQILHQK